MTAIDLPPPMLQLDAGAPWLRLLGRCAIRAGLLGKSPRMVFMGRRAGKGGASFAHALTSGLDPDAPLAGLHPAQERLLGTRVDAALAKHLADLLAAVPDYPGARIEQLRSLIESGKVIVTPKE